MANYDKYYQTEDFFGAPYPELMAFFESYSPKGTVIDVGCGQGRDCIPLARMGYTVTGIDNSEVGINQMVGKSKPEGLNITGLVGDIYAFESFQDYDIVLLDSMFHFEKRDRQRETELIKKIARQIDKNALICVCIQDTGNKVKILKDTISESGFDFKMLNDSPLVYKFEDKASGHKSETKYRILIVQKR